MTKRTRRPPRRQWLLVFQLSICKWVTRSLSRVAGTLSTTKPFLRSVGVYWQWCTRIRLSRIELSQFFSANTVLPVSVVHKVFVVRREPRTIVSRRTVRECYRRLFYDVKLFRLGSLSFARVTPCSDLVRRNLNAKRLQIIRVTISRIFICAEHFRNMRVAARTVTAPVVFVQV